MARTTAPLFSLDASGTIAKALVFSKWRGRQYVRRHAIPKNPQSPAQVGIRTALKFLTQNFAADVADITEAFTDLAANANISILNAYVQFNMRRWRMGHGLAIGPDPVDAGTSVTITQALTGGQRNVLVSVTPSATTDMWGTIIMRDSSSIATANWNLAIAILKTPLAQAYLFTDGPLAPGTYHYRSRAMARDGSLGTACTDATAAAS